MSTKKRKMIAWIAVLILFGGLSVEHFKQNSEIKTLRVKEKALSVKIKKLSADVEQLVYDTLQYASENSSIKSENALLSKQNVLIKSAFKKRDMEAMSYESKLTFALRALEEAKKEKAAIEEQLASQQKNANKESNNRNKDSAAIAALSKQVDSLINIRVDSEIPKKCLNELRYRFSPRIACLTGGVFERSCEKITKAVHDYLQPLSEAEVKDLYSGKGKQLRKNASANSVSPELLLLVGKSLGFNPPESICADQTKQVLKSTIESGDFETWCLTLFNISPTDVANAKAAILNIHNRFE